MGMWRGLIAIVALMASLAASAADAKWLRADTENFIIYSEGNERSLRDFAQKLQRFDATLRYRFKVSAGQDPNRLTIYLLPQAEDAGRLMSGRRGSSIAGFYAPDPEGSFAVSYREDLGGGRGTPQSQQTLFHEYSHHFMKRYVTAAFPAWFIEGFAEYYSTVDFTSEGKVVIGRPVFGRAHGLLALPKIPADRLLLERPNAMRYSEQTDVYYGRAWLLTHMLYNDAARAGQLTSYIDAINRGEKPREAATDAFGDLAQLDKDLNRYLVRPLTYRTSADPIAVPGTVKVTPLSAAEGALIPLRLERLSAHGEDERTTAVREDLRKLSALYPGDAGVWFELAMAEWDRDEHVRDLADVRAATDRALAINPNHVRANVLLGQLLALDMDKKNDFSAATWRDVRKPIALANRTNPDDPVPLYIYFKSFIDQGVNPPDIAIQGLERAFLLAPENIETRITYAFALANKGDFERAITLVQSVAFDPHGADNGELLRQLEKMRDQRSGINAAAAKDAADAAD